MEKMKMSEETRIKLPARWVGMGAYAEIQDAEENVIATTRGIFNGVGYAGPEYWAQQIVITLNKSADLEAAVSLKEYGYRIKTYDDETPICGPDTPPISKVSDLLRYFITVFKRFGDTAVTVDASWGGSALHVQDALRTKLAEVEAEKDRWRLALESLTPTGSEFVNDLDRCMDYIIENRSAEHRRMTQAVIERKRVEKERDAYKLALEPFVDTCANCGFSEEDHDDDDWVDRMDEIGQVVCGDARYPAQAVLEAYAALTASGEK